MTKVPGVYAGGDVEHGPRTVVEAIRSGKIVANAIDAWLRGEPMDNATGTPVRRADVLPLHVAAGDRTHLPRAETPERTVEEVVGLGNYVEIEEGLTDAMAHDEARRCLTSALAAVCAWQPAARWASTRCAWPTANARRPAYFDFTVQPSDRLRRLQPGTPGPALSGSRMRSACSPAAARRPSCAARSSRERPLQPLLTCSECGAPTQTPAHRQFIRGRLPDHMAALLDRDLCPSCARLRADRPAGRGAPPLSRDPERPRSLRSRLRASGTGYLGSSHEGRHGAAGGCGSVRFEEVPEPDQSTGSILVQVVAVGICGTDVEIASGAYCWASPGWDRLILGHESLGRVVDPGPGSGLQAGDLIVGIRPPPRPGARPNCAVGEWDMCRNGQYTERGIKQIDGFMSERWRIEPGYFTKLDPSLGILGVLL